MTALRIDTSKASQEGIELRLEECRALGFYTSCRDVQETIARLEVPPEGSQPLHFDSQFAQSQLTQYLQLVKRNFTSYARNPAYNGTR